MTIWCIQGSAKICIWQPSVIKTHYSFVYNIQLFQSLFFFFKVLKNRVTRCVIQDNFTGKDLSYRGLKEGQIIHLSFFFLLLLLFFCFSDKSLQNLCKGSVNQSGVIFLAPKLRAHSLNLLAKISLNIHSIKQGLLISFTHGSWAKSYSSLSRTSHRLDIAGSSR